MSLVLGQKLDQIRSNDRKKVKLASSIGFSHIFYGEYTLKQEVVVVYTPEWKFKAKIARNAKFRTKLLPKLLKMTKNWLFSRISLWLVSPKVTKLIIQFLSFSTNSLSGPFGAKMLVQVGSKTAKNVVFIPASTLLRTQFS